MAHTPPARSWTKLDAAALLAGSPAEWQKALALARAFALRRTRGLGGDAQDLIQDAVLYLDQHLRNREEEGESKAVASSDTPPESILLQYFAGRAWNAARDRATHERLLQRRSDELSPEIPRAPDDLLDERRWAAACAVAVTAERDGPDRALLEAVLLGRSLGEIASESGLAKTTVHSTLKRLRERLRERILAELNLMRGKR